MNDIAVIHLQGTRGKFAVIDADMFDEVSRFNWFMDRDGYAMCTSSLLPGDKREMGGFINKTPKVYQTDHRNGVKLDNRRNNLRIATFRQQGINKPKLAGCTSKYRGVRMQPGRKRKWEVSIRIHGKKTHIGRFLDEADAAMVYNHFAKLHFGEFARLNIFNQEPAAVAVEQKD